MYFDKSASELTLAESALIAAIPQSPSQNPLDDPVAAKERQRVVLQSMANEGFISQEAMDTALSETIVLSPLALRFDNTCASFCMVCA